MRFWGVICTLSAINLGIVGALTGRTVVVGLGVTAAGLAIMFFDKEKIGGK